MSFASARRLALALPCLLTLVLGCTPESRELAVDLQTDFVPGVEFDLVTVTLDDGAPEETAAAVTHRYDRPRRVLEAHDVLPGHRTVVVVLTRGGSEVARRRTEMAFDRSYLLTVVITRSCRDVTCDVGDDTECVAGMCVPPDCTRLGQTGCPEVECHEDSDCTAGAACGQGRCIEGACLELPRHEMCPAEEICVPEVGCIVRPTNDDAGVPADASTSGDAGSIDAGPIDAVTPDAPATPPDAFGPDTPVRTGACVGQPAGSMCRPSTQACDAPEFCNGLDADCPPDLPSPVTTSCRAAMGPCDVAEVCDGVSFACPADAFVTGGECRTAMGPCDVAESCDGSGPACPSDARAATSVVCRPSAGGCDVAEQCDGVSVLCPTDRLAPTATTCRAASGGCDVAEQCNGASALCPANAVRGAGFTCRAVMGMCDVAETCNGTNTDCPPDAFASSGVCRAAAGVCDVAESCNGTGANCPTNTFLGASTTCRPMMGTCDVAETCTGTMAGCPADAFAPSTTICRAAVGQCNSAERCTGSSGACPADVFAPAGTLCTSGAGGGRRCGADSPECNATGTCVGGCMQCCDDLGSGEVCYAGPCL